jgi:hypothetical protein
MRLAIELSDDLAESLISAASERHMHPSVFASQTVEAHIASLRLAIMRRSRLPARLIGEPKPKTVADNHREPRIALAPVDVPTCDDLGSLNDIY